FRQDFEREASRIMGRTVVVHGSVDARILPFPSVTLNDVRVGEPADGAPPVEVARFSMDAALAPFLSGAALIFYMRTAAPKARVKLFSDGTLDWARGRRSAIPARTVVLENVTVSGGEIEFVDEQTGRTRHVTGLDAQIAARSLAGPWRIDGRASLDGESGAFQLSSGQAAARSNSSTSRPAARAMSPGSTRRSPPARSPVPGASTGGRASMARAAPSSFPAARRRRTGRLRCARMSFPTRCPSSPISTGS